MVAKLDRCWREVSCSFERFRHSSGNGLPNADEERDLRYTVEKTERNRNF